MIKLSKWQSSGRQKSMCFAAQGRLQGWAAKLLLAHRKSWYNGDLLVICLTANSFIAFGNLHFKINRLSNMNMSITYI